MSKSLENDMGIAPGNNELKRFPVANWDMVIFIWLKATSFL